MAVISITIASIIEIIPNVIKYLVLRITITFMKSNTNGIANKTTVQKTYIPSKTPIAFKRHLSLHQTQHTACLYTFPT